MLLFFFFFFEESKNYLSNWVTIATNLCDATFIMKYIKLIIQAYICGTKKIKVFMISNRIFPKVATETTIFQREA